MGIPPIGVIGTSPLVYNVRRVEIPVYTEKENIVDKLSSNTASNVKEKENNHRRFDFVDFSSNEPPPDFKAISLIKKSEIPPPEPPDVKSADRTVRDFRQTDTIKNEQIRIEEKQLNKSATVKSSDEIAVESSPSRLTASQKQGIEIYQKFINYQTPLNMSNAMAF